MSTPSFRSRALLSLPVAAWLLASALSCDSSDISSPTSRVAPPDASARAVAPGQVAHFYVVAFVDDWQLFMGDRLPASLSSASQVTFVITSSGDKNSGMAYVQMRESAGSASIDTLLHSTAPWTCATAVVSAHSIRRCSKGAVVVYYMRLPDGAPTGTGYAGRGSMSMLRDGAQATITTIDNTTTYASWTDLVSTIRAIVDTEGAGQAAPNVVVNTFDYDRTLNPSDHPDRLATADAVNAASTPRSWSLNWFIGTQSQFLAVNLTQSQHDFKAALFDPYDAIVGAAGYGHPKYDSDVQAFFWRTYSRNSGGGAPVPPAAPSALLSTTYSSTRIDLTWTNNATNATSIDIERAPSVSGAAGTFALIASVGPTATAYSVTALSPTTAYWFRIRARNSSGVSGYSNSVTATTATPPAAPTGFSASAASSSRINLAWTNVATGVTGNSVERAPDVAGAAGTYAVVATLPASSTSYGDSGLSASTRYWYRIRATTATDSSAYSAAASATTLAAPPAAPTSLTATAASSSRIDLAWIDNATNETSVVVERAPDVAGGAGTYAVVATLAAGTTSYADQSLTAATRYWYRVRAANSSGSSAYSNVASATTQPLPVGRSDVYVHGHEDDWQLFMGDGVNTSLQTAAKVVFVYLSAGDANMGSAYWRLRETAAKNAVDVLLAAGGSWTCATQTVNAHPIQRCVRGVAVSYFLRLPDGAPSGEGFNGRGSMGQLRDGYIGNLQAMDSSTTYASWADLTNTLGALIALETNNGTGPAVTVASPEYDRTLNPGDHPDHLATADLVRATALTHSWNTSWYRGYVTQNLAVNETQAVHDVKQNAFYGYDNTMGAAGYGYSRYESNYQAWLWRSYSRQVAAP